MGLYKLIGTVSYPIAVVVEAESEEDALSKANNQDYDQVLYVDEMQELAYFFGEDCDELNAEMAEEYGLRYPAE